MSFKKSNNCPTQSLLFCVKFHQNAEKIGSVDRTKVLFYFILITRFSQKIGFWIKFFNFKAQNLSNTNNIKINILSYLSCNQI
jgi:hypothetical protein